MLNWVETNLIFTSSDPRMICKTDNSLRLTTRMIVEGWGRIRRDIRIIHLLPSTLTVSILRGGNTSAGSDWPFGCPCCLVCVHR
ncbi:hypothetical protein HanIR_Chr14g0675551 [Helianthus annuus]|nr:hypothetical protein HanIR_Chr14g0675551 [Helianthus annuus]